ncbi:MAG: hypothetical protein SYC29_12825 [Planctomycetota bacterium]|nr:hypothetical protein [Planctomycetota bacterium]
MEAARDLCARYLEEVQAGRLLPEAATSGGSGGGKYDVSRQIGFTTDPRKAESTEPPEVMRLFDAG